LTARRRQGREAAGRIRRPRSSARTACGAVRGAGPSGCRWR